MKIKTLNRDVIEAETGYRPFTTFFEDFSIADQFGTEGIKETYQRALKEWKHDYKYLTEFVMILSLKASEHAGSNDAYTTLYCDLYYEAKDYALDHLKGDELEYFIKTID